MNSTQYAQQQQAAYKTTLANAGLAEQDYTGVCLSADRTQYEVVLKDGSVVLVSSGFEYCPD
jgi:adenosylcobinamide amidohydrolase